MSHILTIHLLKRKPAPKSPNPKNKRKPLNRKIEKPKKERKQKRKRQTYKNNNALVPCSKRNIANTSWREGNCYLDFFFLPTLFPFFSFPILVQQKRNKKGRRVCVCCKFAGQLRTGRGQGMWYIYIDRKIITRRTIVCRQKDVARWVSNEIVEKENKKMPKGRPKTSGASL